jgi:hypothetical protein
MRVGYGEEEEERSLTCCCCYRVRERRKIEINLSWSNKGMGPQDLCGFFTHVRGREELRVSGFKTKSWVQLLTRTIWMWVLLGLMFPTKINICLYIKLSKYISN